MSILSYLKTHSVLAGTIAIVAVATAVIAGRVSSEKAVTVETGTNLKHVTLIDIDMFRADTSQVKADGIVESVSQVDLKSQMSAPLSAVSVSLGDNVVAGEIIAELENADIRAQLDQAKASLGLEDVSLDSTRRDAIDAMSDAYLKADNAVHTDVDPLFLNTTGTSPQLSSFITDRVLYDEIRAIREDLNPIFQQWKKAVDGLSTNSSDATLQATLVATEKNISKIRTMLDKISQGLNYAATVALPSDLATLNTWKATISADRTSMSNVDGSITAAVRSLNSALITSGSTNTSTSVANAGVRSLEATLAKTIIRAPIAGKVAALPLRVGELATAGQLVAIIVGPGGLEIDAFMSGEDITRIAKGARATIQGTTTGTVISIAPSVNQTNKKVEVKILVEKNNSGLVIGQNVYVSINTTAGTQSTDAVVPYRLPIQNVKIVPGDAYVFTVDADSKVVSHRVTLQKVEGDYVEIVGDIRAGMKIATPVYELEEGQTVTVE